MPTHFHRGGG